jgi:hypothetical protein
MASDKQFSSRAAIINANFCISIASSVSQKKEITTDL